MSKVVIIGSGLGGLSCGLILARNGHEVTILEQGAQPGGCLQCFSRRGAKFETGMHFIGSMRPGEPAYRLLKYMGIDDLPLSQLDPDGFDVVSIAGKRYKIANGRDKFVETLAAEFPHQRENLERYYDMVRSFSEASNLHSLKPIDSSNGEISEFLLRSVDDIIGSVITDPKLQSVLVGELPLYAGVKGKTPFSTHAFIMDFYSQGAYRIVGGSDALTEKMLERLGSLDGKVLTRTQAAEIVCDDTRATGVRSASGEFFPADHVISTIHPTVTMELIKSSLIRPAFRHRLERLPNTVGSFAVYIKFKPDAIPYMNYNFFGYRTEQVWDCQFCSPEEWPKSYLYMHMCHEDGAKWASSAMALTYMGMDELQPWLNTKVGRRGKDYEEFKRRKTERLLDEVEKDFPGLRQAIDCVYTSTPLTYRDYTGIVDGSLYGVAKDVTNLNETRVSHRTRIPNLLLAGQSINSHGLLGVMVGSVVACSFILSSGEVIRQIEEANGDKKK